MQRVTGIGGFFFRSENPEALAQWYRDHFGIDPIPADYDSQPWQQQAGPTAFAPFPKDTDYFGGADKHWMLNLRVADLPAMVEQLRAAGIAVTVDPQAWPNGKFARLYDPEGNALELWEPLRKPVEQS